MISRILALLALSIFVSGCTQLISLPEDSTDASQAAESTPPSSQTTPDTEAVAQAAPVEPEEVAPVVPEPAVEAPPATQAEEVAEAPEQESPVESDMLVQTPDQQRSVTALCREIGNKLGSVSVEDCLAQPLAFAGAYTVQSRPIVVRDFYPDESIEDAPRILIMGGIHGDEYSSISIMFRWMEQLAKSEKMDFRWRFAPSVNPDGLLDGQAIRQNANGVDLNRNFPSDDWLDLAANYWTNTTNRNPRRYPGTHPASEPEVRWIVQQIQLFKPDVIVSVHAPYHLLDYDGPPEPPQRIGELHLHLLGVYPGSLGNYAGINLGIPVVTMELPSAGIMPSNEQISKMWNDLLEWLYEHHES